MYDIAGILGWIVVWGFVFVMLNFVLKFFNKKLISKLPQDKKKFVVIYRTVMKFVLKYHKLVGIITSLTVIIHLVLMSIFVKVSITGLIAMILMLGIFFLGIYGAYFNKNLKGIWLKIHRVLAFLLIIAIIVHVM